MNVTIAVSWQQKVGATYEGPIAKAPIIALMPSDWDPVKLHDDYRRSQKRITELLVDYDTVILQHGEWMTSIVRVDSKETTSSD